MLSSRECGPEAGHRRSREPRSASVKLTLAVVPLALLAACGGGSDDGKASDGKPTITVAGTPLSTADILMNKANDEGLPGKAGFTLDYKKVATVAVLYQDFTAGRYDCILTDPAVFAEQASQGLPVTIEAAVSPNFSYLLTRKDSGIKDPGDLKGKRLVAATSTGGYKVFTAQAQKWYGVDLAKDVQVVQATTDADGLAQIASGSADAMFTFETSVTKSLKTDPNVAVVYAPATDYQQRTGDVLWQNVLACRTDHHLTKDGIGKLVDAMSSVGEETMADPKGADDFAVAKLDAEPGVYAEAFGSGRFAFDIAPLDDKNTSEMKNMITFQQGVGTLGKFDLPAKYFGGI